MATDEKSDKKKPEGLPKVYPEGNWQRKTSYALGEYLKIEDQTETVNRGGKNIKIVKNLGKHVPVIPIGHLDDYGKELLDAMLEGNDSIMEIVEFFKNYKPIPGAKFNKKKFAAAQAAKIEEENASEGESGSEGEKESGDGNNKEEELPKKVAPKKAAPKKVKPKKAVPKKPKKEKPVPKIIPPNPDYTFDLNDPDFEKIPFMHPDTKEHTFEEWFLILYSVCDPKGLTDDQCVLVMETRMGGSYLEELQDMMAKKYKLPKIEAHFLRKDLVLDGYIFDLNDPDFEKIPFMHPDTKTHTFEDWFEILYSVCDPKGLTDDQCVNVMEIRMGGSYLKELKDMKAKKYDLESIELHFLKKDMQEAMLELSKNCKKFKLKRSTLRQKWGLHMSYTKNPSDGLHLVIDDVKERSPAWNSGLRSYDGIVSIHDWIITVMDNENAALSLFQACGQEAILGVLEDFGADEELHAMGSF